MAKPGDSVFVTGYLGESGYGFKLLQLGDYQHHNHFIKQHIRPRPRLDFVNTTATIDRICLNDVSDGLSSELNEIADASNVSMLINWEDIPVHPDMTYLEGFELEKLLLSTGEDFQLVGTCSQNDLKQIQINCQHAGIKVSKIGKVLDNNHDPTVYINKNGTKSRLDSQGYQHGKCKGD
ncbi:thiamine-phosphate kinase [Piscibacillus salipiscarius]|uniref:thiamine-phosphate kinase n=1 Tax=Piscibacillus salipiscarius TaxID=299480 RepID=UPI0006D031C5|nr:AIR synthase-related protein [Piscibacillus salipiscarius]